MATSTLTSKGQITLPQVVRRTLGLEAGDKVDFVSDAAGGFKVVAPPPSNTKRPSE
jgi:antitoxin PrlF